MEGSKAGSSSSIDPKKKSADLDGDIGKEFLSSWKSMSVTEDDAMDFDFDTVPSFKKKAFNFDKMDMDFNLDGDFKKISSSFKVDMSDLDFSSPAKNTTKKKEGSKEESSSGKRQGKHDRFSFSFDFNELDNFNFGSSLVEQDKKSSESSCGQKTTADTGDQETGDVRVVADNLTTKAETSVSLITSKINAFAGDPEDHCFMIDSPAKSDAGDLVPSKGTRTSAQNAPRRSPRAEMEKKCVSSEDKNSVDSCPQHFIEDLPIQSISGNNLTQDVGPGLQTKFLPPEAVLLASSGGDVKVNEAKAVDPAFNHETSRQSSLLNDTGPLDSRNESSMQSDNSYIKDKVVISEPVECVSDLQDVSGASASRDMLSDNYASSVIKNSSLPLNTSRFALDKNRIANEREAGAVRSKYFRKPDESENFCGESPMLGKVVSTDNKSISAMNSGPEDDRRHIGGKMTSNMRSLSGGLTRIESRPRGNEKICTSFNTTRKSSKDGSTHQWGKLAGNTRQNEEKVAIVQPVSLGSGKKDSNTVGIGDQENSSNSTEEITKHIFEKGETLKSADSSTVDSALSAKIKSLETNKLTSLRASLKTPDLSALKISRLRGENNNQLDPTCQKGEPVKNLEQAMDTTLNTASEKQIPATSCLKRKSYEVPVKDSLNSSPFKRLSVSPRDTRIRETSEKVTQKQAWNQQSMENTNRNSPSSDRQTPKCNISPNVDLTEPEISLVMENDGNVGKAEAYSKDLEEICNMLKKKHEEVKELLVRAVVNNNNLLMLNHPIYEDKIRRAQKFAALLMSREIQT